MRFLRHVENHFVQQRGWVSFFCFGSSKLIEDDNNVGIVFFILKTKISKLLGLVALPSTNFGIHFFSAICFSTSRLSRVSFIYLVRLSSPTHEHLLQANRKLSSSLRDFSILMDVNVTIFYIFFSRNLGSQQNVAKKYLFIR